VKNYLKKAKHILPAYLLVGLSSLLFLGIARYFLDIKYHFLTIPEDYWHIWIPLVFPWIPILILLRPKLKVLAFKGDSDNGRSFFLFITWVFTCFLLIFSQQYLKISTAKLLKVDKIAKIKKQPFARYYLIDSFDIIKSYSGAYTDFRKIKNELYIDIHFVVPMANELTDSVLPKCNIWYGIKFSKRIRNSLSHKEKEKKYKKFYNQSVDSLEAKNFNDANHYERLTNSKKRKNFYKAIHRVDTTTDIDSTIILEPIFNSFKNKKGAKPLPILVTFVLGLIVFLISLLWPKFNKFEYNQYVKGNSFKKNLAESFSFLIPKKEQFMSSIMIYLMLVIFIFQLYKGLDPVYANGNELLELGANRKSETIGKGQLWRLITSIFLHGSYRHLALNIVGLIIASIYVEPTIGRVRFLLSFLLTGILGSLSSSLWYDNVISVGASGAILGIIGVATVLYFSKELSRFEKRMILILLGPFTLFTLLWGLLGGIDNAAHIGGLLSGIVLGIVFIQSGLTKDEPLE